MMKVDLRTLLVGGANLSSLVGDRVYWVVRDKEEGVPCIVLTVIDGPPDYHLNGPSGLVQSRVQANLFAVTYTDVDALERAFMADIMAADASTPVTDAIHALSIDNRRDLTDTSQPDYLFLTAVDLMIDHY